MRFRHTDVSVATDKELPRCDSWGGRKSVADSVATALEGRFRLLVIDNCEHVLNAAADLVEDILTHSATVKILVTSREGLGLADEQL